VTRRDAQVITAIWLGTLYAWAWIADENQTADEELNGVMLYLFFSSVATGVYVLIRRGRMSEQTTTPPQGRRSSAWWGVADVVVVFVLWMVGSAIAWNLGVPDTPSEFVGLLLPLAFLLVRQIRRSRTAS
jgi:hypothetical protein